MKRQSEGAHEMLGRNNLFPSQAPQSTSSTMAVAPCEVLAYHDAAQGAHGDAPLLGRTFRSPVSGVMPPPRAGVSLPIATCESSNGIIIHKTQHPFAVFFNCMQNRITP